MKGIFGKVIVMVAAMSLASVVLAQGAGPKGGQGAPPQGGRPGGQSMQGFRQKMEEAHKRVLGTLNLTADQKTKVAALDKDRAAKTKAIRDKAQKAAGANGGRPPQGLRDEMRKITEDYNKKLGTILGADKYKKYQAGMKAEMDKLRSQFGGQRPGGTTGGKTGGGKTGGGKTGGGN